MTGYATRQTSVEERTGYATVFTIEVRQSTVPVGLRDLIGLEEL